jgi:NADH-quinone oxidoreductase subunit C
MITTEIIDNIKVKMGDALLSAEQQYDFTVFTIKKENIHGILKMLKEDETYNFHFLTTMCGVHYPDYAAEKEFSIVYQLHNMPNNWRIRLNTFMPKSDIDMPTVTDIYPTANWMEREAYDFYGFTFAGHPDLRRILNMDEMNYFPLRKEYPLEDGTRGDKSDNYFGR